MAKITFHTMNQGPVKRLVKPGVRLYVGAEKAVDDLRRTRIAFFIMLVFNIVSLAVLIKFPGLIHL